MNLQELASLAEIIGAIAVTLSLLFVGVQIRKNTAAEQATALQNTVAQDVQMCMTLGASDESGQALIDYSSNPESLTGQQLTKGRWLFAASFRQWENVYLQYLSGNLSDQAWRSREATVREFILTPGYKDYMSSFLGKFHSGPFLDYAETMLQTKDG